MNMYQNALSAINAPQLFAETLGAILATAGFAFLSLFAIPSIQRRYIPPPMHDELWTFLPFRKIAEDRKTIICEEQRHLRVIEIEGAEITLAGDQKHEELFNSRKTWIDDLERLELQHVKIITLKQNVSLARTLRPANPILRAIDEQWESNFKTPTTLTHYIILIAKGKTLEETRRVLDNAENYTHTQLSDYKPVTLTDDEIRSIDDIEDPENKKSGPLKVFAHILSPITKHNPTGSDYPGPLSALLTADTVDFSKIGRGTLIFQQGNQKKFASVITWRDCGDKSSEAIMRELSCVDYEMIIYHAIEPIQQTIALMKLKQSEKTAAIMHLSTNAVQGFTDTIKEVEGISQERTGLAYYAMHVIPICDTEEQLIMAQKEIIRTLSQTSGTGVILRSMAQPTYLSMVDPAQAWPRRFRFLSTNIAASVYPQRTTKGHLTSDWSDEPISWLRTLSGDPYPFHFHSSSAKQAIGHLLVVGASGQGKTTTTTFLAAQAMRIPRLRLILLDRLHGMKVFTACAGGNYVDFDSNMGRPLFNPLLMPNTERNKTFLLQWLKEITGLNDSKSAAEFARMVNLIHGRGDLPENMRSLKALSKAAFDPTGQARYALTPWIEDNQYGRIFNAPRDTLNLKDTRLSCFNMTQLLDDKTLAPAVVSYLVHRIQGMSFETGDPTFILVDETSAVLRNEMFATRFLDTGLMEGRKLRQVYALCFQTPQALYNTGRQQIILDQCDTKIIFRMRRDSEDSINQYDAMGLNKAEKDFIAGRTFKNFPYAVLIKRGSGDSAIVNVDLRSIGPNLMKVFQSGVEDSNRMDALLKTMPREQAVQTYLHSS